MGRGTSNRGISSIKIKVDCSKARHSATDYVTTLLEKKLGAKFQMVQTRSETSLNYSLILFQDSIKEVILKLPENASIELTFTLVGKSSWEDALSYPDRDILIQTPQQIQYKNERNAEELEKKEKQKKLEHKWKQQAEEDENKGILRASNGTVIWDKSQYIYNLASAGSFDEAKFEYVSNGLKEYHFRILIKAYHDFLSAQLIDIQKLFEWLMDESNGYRGAIVSLGLTSSLNINWENGQFKTKTSRPTELGKKLIDADEKIRKAFAQYRQDQLPEDLLTALSEVEEVISKSSAILSRFWQESVEEAHRIGFGLQVLQVVIPLNGAKGLYQIACTYAASNFSYAITNKIINSSDDSWISTLYSAGIDSGLQFIFQLGASKLLTKIGGVGGLDKLAFNIAINKLSNDIATTLADGFKGKTFGEALSNFHHKLTNPEDWFLQSVSSAAGFYHDEINKTNETKKTVSNNKQPHSKPDKSPPNKASLKPKNYTLEQIRSKLKTYAIPLVLLFSPPKIENSSSNKPIAQQIDNTQKSKASQIERATEGQNTKNKPVESVKVNDPQKSINFERTIGEKGIKNKGTDDKKTVVTKPVLPPANSSVPISPFLLTTRRRRADGIDFDFVSSDKDSIEFEKIRTGDWVVYTFHDISGVMIYIGITQKTKSMKTKKTRDAIKRFQEHLVKKDSEFIGDASIVKIQGAYDDKLLAQALEQDFINQHTPKYNVDMISWESYKAGGHPKGKVTNWADLGMNPAEIPKINRNITFKISISNP